MSSDVGDPYRAYAEIVTMRLSQKVFPEWLVELFGEAIGMSPDDGDIARLWIGVVDWDVLLDVKMYHGLLRFD